MADDDDYASEYYDADDYDEEEEEEEEEGNFDAEDQDDDDDAEGDQYDVAEDDDRSASSAPKIKVITKESLLAAQKEDLQRVMDLLLLREHHARTLLIHFRWDVDTLISVFVERGVNVLFSLAGIVLDKVQPSFVSDSSMVDCQICCEEMPASEVTYMDCGHHYCKNCWTEYFIVQIQEGMSKRIKCMAYKCHAICDEEIVRDLVRTKDQSTATKFENILLESYVEDNDKVKWCPSVPHCGNAISVDVVCDVQCTCGLEFCFGCLAEAHSPCSCYMWRLWVKKCASDSETAKWVSENTKPCPKCFKPVIKDGGCNHVVCICGQPMCWLCGAPTGLAHTTRSIEGHNCGSYKEEDKEHKNTEKARKRIWRFHHYFNHFQAHIASLKLESALKEKVSDRISILENLKYEKKDYSWLVDGFNLLFSARRILAYSYPFAFYMFGDELFTKEMTESSKKIEQGLFENQQTQFAEMVERLSHVLENEIEKNPTENELKKLRDTALNLLSVTDCLCREMYSCIENDLLGPLSTGSLHQIAAYQSYGFKKALEL